MRPWPKRKPELDERFVGITFVDVLFALVIGKVLEPFADVDRVPAVGRVQLVLAGVLTVASWIGYHNSWNRPRYFIRFPNLPLAQFLIDVLLVVLYFLTAISAPGATPGVERELSAVPVAVFVALSFLLYALWDVIAYRIRQDERYTRRTREHDVPERRVVSYVFAVATALIAAIVVAWDPSSTAAIVALELGLIAVIVTYRFLKEYVTPENVRATGEE